MSTLLTEPGLYTYEAYMAAFDEWVQEGTTSSANASASYAGFTKLNLARSKRLHKTISLNSEIVHAAENIQHEHGWVVLTEAWCGDSAQTLPVIAEIAKLNPEKIKLNILLRDENPEMIDKYLTNGARAIPKLIVTDDTTGKEIFVWGPRPAPAQKLLSDWKKNPDGKSWDDFEKELHGWYAKDKTETTQSEFLELVKKMQ